MTTLSPPTPRLRPGFLLSDDVEIGTLKHTAGSCNLYSAQMGSISVLALEHPMGPQLLEIPDHLSTVLPSMIDCIQKEDREYLIIAIPHGHVYPEAQLPCDETAIVQLLCHTLTSLEALRQAQFDLSTLSLGDLWIDENQALFLIPPIPAETPSDTAPWFHHFVQDLLVRKLNPRKTRNLENPLACLKFSASLNNLLTSFLDGTCDQASFLTQLQQRRDQPSPRWQIAAHTDPGLLREHNEDACAWFSLNVKTHLKRQNIHLLAVADGMGGHQNGEIASHLAIEQLFAFCMNQSQQQQQSNENTHWVKLLAQALNHTQTALLQSEQLQGAQRGGSTMVVGLMVERTLYLAHCGDSRAYRLKNHKLERLTQDHSLVQLYVDRGDLSPDEAFGHEMSHVITSYLGIEPKRFKYDINVYHLAPGERLLICSDGLSDMIPEPEIAQILNSHHDPQQVTETLIGQANAYGGEDNISVITLIDPTAGV